MSKWYEEKAEHNDIVLSSRIRLARNVAKYPFQHKMTAQQRCELNQSVQAALADQPDFAFLDVQALGEITRYALVERHVISRELAEQPTDRMLVLSQDESVSIMVNEEDHLRIQVLKNGLNLTGAYARCSQVDDVLDSHLHYAFDEKLGYLTTSPTNLGTGLCASVMMHLPALEQSGLISTLTATISKLGLTICGTYGEGSNVLGSIYQISNQITLGITEQDSIQNLESVVLQIVESEQQARRNLAQNKLQVEDLVYRSLGTLQYARLISAKEFFELFSHVRLGVSLGILSDVSLETLNCLMNRIGTANVCEYAGKQLSAPERDSIRGQMIREILP